MIREIYCGDFRPSDNAGKSDNYQAKRQIAYELGRRFKRKVGSDNLEEFEEVLTAHMEVLITGMEDSYISGFCDGVKLISEALGNSYK